MGELLTTTAKGFFFQGGSIDGPVALAMAIHTDGHVIGEVFTPLHPLRCYLYFEVKRCARIGKGNLDKTNNSGQANDHHAQDDTQDF